MYAIIGPGKLYGIGRKGNDSSFIARRQPNGVELRRGIAKGVRIVRDDHGAVIPAVVLDCKVSPFFKTQSLDATITEMLNAQRNEGSQEPNWDQIKEFLYGVRVQVKYRPSRSFQIGGFTDKPFSKLKANINGSTEFLVEYFKAKYKITIKNASWPAVFPKESPGGERRETEAFPIEQLFVMENQRVPIEKFDATLQDDLLVHNTVDPADRMNEIFHHARKLKLFDDNPLLEGFGISVDKNSNKVLIGLRSLPEIRFRNKQVQPDPVKGNWLKSGLTKYLSTKKVGNWLVIRDDRKNTTDDVDRFIKDLIRMARDKGLELLEPRKFCFNQPNGRHPKAKNWEVFFENYVRNAKWEYIMLIDNGYEDTHGLIKFFEACYKIPTQQVTLEKVREVLEKNRRQTLENIINKFNCKHYGINYEPSMEASSQQFSIHTGDVLVIGYDVSHPPPMRSNEMRLLREFKRKYETEKEKEHGDGGMSSDTSESEAELDLTSVYPSTVGICANMAPNRHNFVGDYFYQKSRKEELDVSQLRERVVWILKNVEKNRPEDKRPKYIFIFRDGLSEGQFNTAYQSELEAIRQGCEKYAAGYKPKLVFIIGTKRHYKRIYEGFYDGSRDSKVYNLPPGSVVTDQRICRADVDQVFVLAHSPFRGSAKPTEYSILANDVDASQDEIQGMILSLCYSHQIVNTAISIPEPVYQADELAKRGRKNFLTLKQFEDSNSRLFTIPYRTRHLPSGRGQLRHVDFCELTRKLSYWNEGRYIMETRFTA